MLHHAHVTFLLIVLCFASMITISAFDCYSCANCPTTQRGVRLTARPEDWCYKIIWRSGSRGSEVVSRGASPDCRQDSYNDRSIPIQGIFSGVARYCCRGHLCNGAPNRPVIPLILLSLTILLPLLS